MTGKLISILVISLFAFSLGDTDCSYRRKCQDLWTAKECNGVKECIPLWEWRLPTGNRDDVCNICLEMVKEARDTLRSNETREELKEVFEGSCALLTLKPAVKMCDKLVDQFVPELVDILSSQMDPEAVCSVARLCNNEEFRTEIRNSAECNNCRQFFYGSEVIMRRLSSDDFRNGLLGVCRTAGAYSDACSHLAMTHADFLHKSANSLPKQRICDATLLCPTTTDAPVTISPQNAVRLGEMCPLCKTVVPNIRKQLLKVRSADAFADNMYRICEELGMSNSTCFQLSRPELYENLKKSEALPELFCRATYCKEKQKDEATPVWPLVSTSEHHLETDFLEFLAFSDMLFEQKKHTENQHPKIAFGDPIVNPMFFGPNLSSKLYQTLSEQKPRVENPHPKIAYGDPIGNPMFFGPDLSSKLYQTVSEQKPHVENPHPKIAYGDPIGNPVFFGPDLTSKLYETDGEECETCQDVFDLLSKPARTDEDYLNKFLSVVCDMSKNTKKCARFMEKFSPFVQTALTEGGVTKEMCAHLVPCQVKRNEPTLPGKCSLCLNVMRVLKDGNSSMIGPALQQKCARLPGVPPHICKDLSSTFDSLASLLQTSNESEACSFVKLCPSSLVEARPVSKPSCQTCMLTIQSLVDTLKSNSSNSVIEHVLDSLCDLLPHVEKRLCTNLVNTVGVEGFKKLIESVDPTEICKELHICKRRDELDMTPASVVPKVFTPTTVTQAPAEPEKVPCRFCMMAIGMLLDQLQDDKTEDAIRKALDNICHYFPEETRDTCQNLIDQYADRIIDMIVADFNATEICTFLKLCPDKHLFGGDGHDQRAMEKNFDVNTNEVRDLEEMEPHETYVPKHVEEAFHDFQKVVQECAMCEALVGVVSTHKSMLNKNYDFSSNAYRICSIVPKNKLQMCTSMIVSYGPSIVNLLVDHKIDPNEVCDYLALCDAQMLAKVNQPVSMPEPEEIPEGKNDCLLGPVFWCANAENAEKCGTFLHCQETVWKSWKSPPTRRGENL